MRTGSLDPMCRCTKHTRIKGTKKIDIPLQACVMDKNVIFDQVQVIWACFYRKVVLRAYAPGWKIF